MVAAVGPATDVATWSGIPFHLLQAGLRLGAFDEGLELIAGSPRVAARRVLWNLGSVARGRGRGGFQYSEDFLELLWADAPPLAGASILNCFCLYPAAIVEDRAVDKWYFIDQTLTQLFDYYEQDRVASSRAIGSALEREAIGYRAAGGIVVNSRWAAASVIDDYSIDPSKVHVVVPGPSLDLDLLEALEPPVQRPPVAPQHPLRLVFVGKEWERKGLDRLLRAIEIARAQGAAVTLDVVGCARETLPPELQGIPDVGWLGYIDKRADQARFISVLRDADVGCLLSRYEAGGISMREYHSLGLAVIGPDTGGSPEHMLEGAAVAIAPEASDEEIAGTLVQLATDEQMLASMKKASWDGRYKASWPAAIASLPDTWPSLPASA